MMGLLKLGILAGSAVLLGWYVAQVDLEMLRKELARLGPWAPLILAPYGAVYLVDCLAWKQTLPGVRLRFLDLLRIRWAGEAVNNIVPSAYIGGEAVKVWLLRRRGIGGKAGSSSVVIAKTAQTIAQVVFIAGASACLFLMARDQPGVRYGIAAVLAGALAAVGGLCWVQRLGALRGALVLARVFPRTQGWVGRHQNKLREFDEVTLRFYREERGRFARSAGLFFLGWLLDTCEIMVAAYLLGFPITWPQALVVEAFAGVAKAAGMWVPGSLGVQESGIVVMSRLAGLPDGLGVAYALIRRARDLLFAGIGWWLLSRESGGWRVFQEAKGMT